MLDADQRESAYLMAARGMHPAKIAEVLWQPLPRVNRALRSKEGMERVAHLRGRYVLDEITHDFQMRGMLGQARSVMSEAMGVGTIPQKQRTAHWLHEQLIAKPAQRVEQRVEVDARVRHDLAPVFVQIKDLLQTVREARERSGISWEERVKLGGEAVKRPRLESGE